jgi:hypothetical protein
MATVAETPCELNDTIISCTTYDMKYKWCTFGLAFSNKHALGIVLGFIVGVDFK